MTRTDIINLFIQKRGYQRYLEIGLDNGNNFYAVKCAQKEGTDPSLRISEPGAQLWPLPSDAFFAQVKARDPRKYDIVFIDGLHEANQVLRDVENCLRFLNDHGAIVVHDCNPKTYESQLVPWPAGYPFWHGDVWKVIALLRTRVPNLDIMVVDTDCGCGIIRRGSQELFKTEPDAPLLTYAYLEAHRKELLNLKTVEEFQASLN